MDKKVGIYCIENKINHKKYIGQSINIHDRWNHHINQLNRNVHFNESLQREWSEYGGENFLFSIIELCDVSNLDALEKHYITLYNTTNDHEGYNLMTGGKSGFSFSKEIKEKIGNSRRGKLHSEETKRKFSETRVGSLNSFYGRHHTEESKQKMRERHYDVSGENNPRFNPEPVICTTTGKVYPSAYQAAKELGLYSSGIRKCCEGKLKTTGGLEFQFYDSTSKKC